MKNKVNELVVGDIVKTDALYGKNAWKIVLNITHEDYDNGLLVEEPGLYLFYGMWYGDDPMNIHSFGKCEHLPGIKRKYYRKDKDGTKFINIGHITEIGKEKFRDHANDFDIVIVVK